MVIVREKLDIFYGFAISFLELLIGQLIKADPAYFGIQTDCNHLTKVALVIGNQLESVRFG